MYDSKKRYDDGTTTQDIADCATCPHCDSEDIYNPDTTCDDCGWSPPSLSVTEITDVSRIYYRCDCCGDTMRFPRCEDCFATEGVPDDE